jgi:hypothetical protein
MEVYSLSKICRNVISRVSEENKLHSTIYWQKNREDCTMRSFITCTFHQILLQLSNQQIKEDGTGRSCSMQGDMRNLYKI